MMIIGGGTRKLSIWTVEENIQSINERYLYGQEQGPDVGKGLKMWNDGYLWNPYIGDRKYGLRKLVSLIERYNLGSEKAHTKQQ